VTAVLPESVAESPVSEPTVPRLELTEWAERYGLVAGITTRGTGAGFSLGLWTEEPVGRVMTRWRAFQAAFGERFPTIILSHQVHGTAVAWHPTTAAGWQITDGLDGHATAAPGHLLTVTVADCIPVYLVVPQRRVAALLHAGWRGTAGKILERGVELLRREAHCMMGDIVMHCGVGICGRCYEVDSEVYERLTRRPGQQPQHVDLRAVLAAQAAELGLGATTVSPFCTAHDHDRFLSHRASSGRDGRLVAYLGFPLPERA